MLFLNIGGFELITGEKKIPITNRIHPEVFITVRELSEWRGTQLTPEFGLRTASQYNN